MLGQVMSGYVRLSLYEILYRDRSGMLMLDKVMSGYIRLG